MNPISLRSAASDLHPVLHVLQHQGCSNVSHVSHASSIQHLLLVKFAAVSSKLRIIVIPGSGKRALSKPRAAATLMYFIVVGVLQTDTVQR
jgi:hypothetical protein